MSGILTKAPAFFWVFLLINIIIKDKIYIVVRELLRFRERFRADGSKQTKR